MNKLSFAIPNCNLKDNVLPHVLNAGYADEWTFSSSMFPRLGEKLMEMLNSMYPDGFSGNDEEYNAQCDKVIAAVDARVKRFFIVNKGKKMAAKFPGKSIEGVEFEAGSTIYYWSNGVDRATVTARG